MDGTDAKYAAVVTKRALNRAVKAASMQIDEDVLATGVIQIDEAASRVCFDSLLRANLFLNPDNTPTARSLITEAPEVLEFYVCQGPFPYFHAYDMAGAISNIKYTFFDPGVMAVIRVKYKYNFIGNNTQDIYVYSVAEIKQ